MYFTDVVYKVQQQIQSVLSIGNTHMCWIYSIVYITIDMKNSCRDLPKWMQ